ncbi:MAG: hypothetical protein KY433_01430 [Actinobacteria bacterium]|nr:hypothetical protein [Actinomycetota bacterium]
MTTTVAPTAQRPRAGAAPFAFRAAVFALARIEGRRLIGHPIFVAGIVLSVAFTLSLASAANVGGDYFALLGPTLLPLGLATLVVSNLAALRWRRGGTAELYRALAAPPHARTLAHLLALAWPTAVAAVLVAAAFAWFGAWDGLDVTREGAVATPAAVDLAQGPLAVAALGALGIALARWIPYPPAAMLAAVAFFFPQMMFTSWNLQGAAGWFLPFVNPAQSSRAPDSSWPCSADQQWPCILDRFAPLHWHLVYVAGLVVLLAAVALLRDGRRRCDLLLAATGFTLVAVAGALQLP